MGYLMRYLVTEEKKLSLDLIEQALKQVDPAYAIRNIQFETAGDLFYQDRRIAFLEINDAQDDIFEDDLAEFLDLVGTGQSAAEQRIREMLAQVKRMVVVEAFWEGTDAEAVLEKVDPLWNWLFAHYAGLSQADNEGFYDRDGFILERRFTL